MSRIYLSYSRADSKSGLVEMLVKELTDDISRATGWDESDVFYLDVNVPAGEYWSRRLVAALRECDAFVALLSPRYFQSETCGKEWGLFERRLARHKERHGEIPPVMIPVLWEEESGLFRIPQFVARKQNYFAPRTGLRKLVQNAGHAKEAYREVTDQLSTLLLDVIGQYKLDAANDDWGDLDDAVNAFTGVSGAQRADQRPPRLLGPGAPDASPGPAYSNQLAGGMSSDLVDANSGIPLDRDSLGVSTYVRMLATVIADKQTQLPLSIGVLGEWGSGKSYFMGLLREQVRMLAKPENATYCGDIKQIGFNAWHYSDTNLWASLGTEIFRQLAGPGADDGARRQRLGAELAGRLEQRRELEEVAEQAQVETVRLRATIDREEAQRSRRAVNLLRAVRGSPELGRRLDDALRRLGVADQTDQGRLLANEIDGARDDVRAVRGRFAGSRGLLVGATAAVVLTAFLVWAVLAPQLALWLTGSGILATVGTLIAGAHALTTRARSGLQSLQRLAEDLRTGTADAARSEIREQLDALRAAEAARDVARSQLDATLSRVAELGRELAGLSPGRRLYGFLTERAESEVYRGGLSLISTVRKDFEHLVELMNEWRRTPVDDGQQPIDRIVLYIDDLDRCSPRQVVDVLQAVHLLLALDLFVVVVGVDPRWLVRALSHHYDEVLELDDSTRPTDGWRVTPEDYLEKILNIPLVLPAMDRGSLRRVFEAMLVDGADRAVSPAGDGSPQRAEPATAPDRAPVDGTDGGSDDADGGGIRIEAGSQAAVDAGDDAEASPRPLTDPELEMLATLDVLIDTPREAKRLMNLYRMLRSTRDLSDASTFLGNGRRAGEYQAVIVLLGLLTAHGRLMGAVLDAPPDGDVRGGLVHRHTTDRWTEFVADLAPERVGSGWRNGIVGPLADAEVRHWDRLARGVARASKFVELTDLSCFQIWEPRIRRFSFALCRSGVERPDTEVE